MVTIINKKNISEINKEKTKVKEKDEKVKELEEKQKNSDETISEIIMKLVEGGLM